MKKNAIIVLLLLMFLTPVIVRAETNQESSLYIQGKVGESEQEKIDDENINDIIIDVLDKPSSERDSTLPNMGEVTSMVSYFATFLGVLVLSIACWGVNAKKR